MQTPFREFILVVAVVIPVCSAAAAGIEKATSDERRATISGQVDGPHQVVLRVDRKPTPTESRSSLRSGAFEVTVEPSEKVPLGGGKTGPGYVVTLNAKGVKETTNVALTGERFVVRPETRFVTKKGELTFADIVLEDGTTVPVSIRVLPAAP